MHIHRFHGGLNLPGHKEHATRQPLRDCPLPAHLRLPLLQHSGDPSRPQVAVGDRVVAGQCIAEPDGLRGIALHAPAAGIVSAIAPITLAYPPGVEVDCIEITVDAEARGSTDRAAIQRMPTMDPWTTEPQALIDRIRAAGVVGLGGAGFPTADKLTGGHGLLALNGAECEPYISCDEMLLRERPDEVLLGAALLARTIAADRIVLAVEDRMTTARAALEAALTELTWPEAAPPIELITVPTRYPEGGERQLIRVLTGLEVPRGGLPADIGVLVHNVATAAAAWRAVVDGLPLIERIVTVTGPGIMAPCNLRVALGTSVAAVVAEAGGYHPQAARLVIGGPMMGVALADDDYPLGKTGNCVLALSAEQIASPGPELPCIRCAACADVCPARLLPQQLLWHIQSENWGRAESDGLIDCIECGCCDLACPSHIPLVQYFRYGKTELRHRQHEAERAAAAKLRHDARQARLAREAEARALRQAQRKTDTTSASAVAEAIARAKARREQRNDPGRAPEHNEPDRAAHNDTST